MIRPTLYRSFVLGCLVAAVSACATSPIATRYRQEAKSEDVSYSMVLQNPDAYMGKIVLWGGSIIETTNLQNGTEITVLQEPLGSEGRPENAEESLGRFIAMSPNFLDPAIYRSGKKVTLAGEVTGKKDLQLGETTRTYPVVTIKQLHLWKNRYYSYPYDYYYWGWGPYGWYPWYPWYPDYDGDYGWDYYDEE